jgi:polyvinyl alcohol dehydrogenase (cytochrome)
MTALGRIVALVGGVVVVCTLAAPAASGPKVSCAPARHAGGEWRSYGHDYANTRTQPSEHVIGPVEAAVLQPAWTFSSKTVGGDGDFTGTPVIADGCVYAGSNVGWVFALNTDDGRLVWKSKLRDGGGINSSPAVFGRRVFVTVSRVGKPAIAALDQTTGRVLWDTTIDTQPGSDVFSSPVYFDGLVFSGWSGGSAELGDPAARDPFQGGFAIVDATNGRILRKTYTIRAPDRDPSKPKDAYAGGGIWSTPAVDTRTKYAYTGSGNPFRPQAEHRYANSILKIDLDRRRPTFGRIVGHYKGTIDEYAPEFSRLPCYDIPGNPPPYYPQGVGQCGDVDMDMGASPNLFKIGSRLVVGAGQKSGVYHVADAGDMKGVWTALVGPPTSVGGIVGSTAYDGGAIYGPITVPGYVWSVDRSTGGHRWMAPVGDGVHWGNPVSVANGVAYTVDLRGFLDGYDTSTGVQVLAAPMWLAGGGRKLTWGGVSIARNTVYAAVGLTSDDGYVIAYRSAAPSGAPAITTQVDSAAALTLPGAQFYGYATPVVVVDKGGQISYTNLDIVQHDFVQDVLVDGFAGSSKRPWCGRFPRKRCPVFWSELAGLGQSVAVQGLGSVKPGKTYSFFCTIHNGMKGKLIVGS